MILIACLLAIGGGLILLQRVDFSAVLSSDGRGTGDTILKYRDRNYESAKWTKLKESASLATLTELGDLTVKLERVIGWDRDNLWVASESGHVFQLKQGHWQYRGRPGGCESPVLRVLNQRTLLLVGTHGSPDYLNRVDDSGIIGFGKIGHYGDPHLDISFPNPDIIDVHAGHEGVIRFADGKREERREDRFPEMFAFQTNNTPLKEYPLRRLQYTRHFSGGEAYAICPPVLDGLAMKYKVVHGRDGRWYEAGEFTSDYLTLKAAWFGGTPSQPFLIAVGSGGWVLNQPVIGTGIQQNVQSANERTSCTLIGVWGVSPEKYWVVDDNGTVWERNGSASRVVVRGYHRDGITFRDVWVSPDGAVYAITDQHIYLLD